MTRWPGWPRPAAPRADGSAHWLGQVSGAALLSTTRGALEPPIRTELLGAAGFNHHGHELAQSHGVAQRAVRAAPFFPHLRQNIATLHEAHRCIAQQEAAGRHVSPAGEWLLDNIHLVVAQTREVHDGLPRRYFRGLPVLTDGTLAGLPRIYAIAWAYVSHADSAFVPALLVDFLSAYQDVHVLTQGELWALPTTLRVVLVENLRRLAERVATEEVAREAAHAACNHAADADFNPKPLLAQLNSRGVLRAFVLQALQRLRADTDSGTGGSEAGMDHELWRSVLANALPEPATAQAQQQVDQAADNMSVGNAVRSLQLLGSADWRGLIAQASSLTRLLLAWPPFAAERDDTQDDTLHAIEQLARRSQRSEGAVAEQLLRLAQQPGVTGAAPVSSLGYWLHGDGAARFRAALGLRAGFTRRQYQAAALPLMLSALALGTLALTLAFMQGAAGPDIAPLWWGLAFLLALWPASETVIAGVNRLISESVQPRRLPRLALARGIPPEHRVMVVLPALLSDSATVQSLVRRLERHHLANRETHAQFALLTDFADALQATTSGDAALLAEARAAIEALEGRCAPDAGQPRRFLLLHRHRRWCESEQRWIGWERKRGKLEQLATLLATPAEGGVVAEPAELAASSAPFLDLGPCSHPAAGTCYILTLDSDTVLPPGALRELVGIAAHPLNQPHIDTRRRRVVAGYGILQPRVVAAWPQDAGGQGTGFHRLFAGASGSDPYNALASEVYQDLFDEGSFTGKGLLHVAAVHAVLAGRLPEDQVLSHDLLEGCIARCGSVSDVALIEGAPAHADVAASRTHRWTRGDWQLLPLLQHASRYGLRAIDRWKLLDNLRRSLVAPAALALLVIGLAGGPISPWAALALAAAAFSAGPLVGAIAGLAPSRDDLGLRHFARQALGELLRATAGLAWHIALWWRQSLLLVDAMVRALWRSIVSRRGLLQWTTAAAAEGAAAQGGWALLRLHARLSLGALALGVALWALATPVPALALMLCTAWALTPLWIAWASRAPRPARPLNADDQAYLLHLARDTWGWFERHVNASTHHLPPDNVQTLPRTMVAQRTSPTNIGLYLLSLACARGFGWVSSPQMAQRLQDTLDTLDQLPRERGHFLNWIDLQSLQTLPPAYVSAVDSGNLCGHLLAVAVACEEPVEDAPLQAHLAQLARRCRQLAEAADFGFLYDPRRRLLHIGWRVSPGSGQAQLDQSHYDLLASEARLASLWAIAKGDVPAAHWAALGRPFQATVREVGLRSWSGSMFEYLMPTLVLDEPTGSALGSAGRMAVQEQRAYAELHRVPWGVSESAYAAADHTLAYQYAPQGVPRLALRRTPPDERVVAPYASALAAQLQPHAAVANLRRLQALQARGSWGFIEALDFTVSRQPEAAAGASPPGNNSGTLPFTPVCTFMAHHQGMVLVALTNVLLEGLPRRWYMTDPRMAAVATLLQERVPREVARLQESAPALLRGQPHDAAARMPRVVHPGAHAVERTLMLSNGRYGVTLRANGAGNSRWGAADITRRRDDALRDAYGSFFYLRWPGRSGPVSLTQHPAPDPAASYSARFHTDRVCLDAAWPDLRSRVTVWVSPEDDIEFRRVELQNTSSKLLTFELMSAWEVSLSAARADEMHPAFANLFITADWDPHDQALYLARKPRREDEAAVHGVHFLAHSGDDSALPTVRAIADRAAWLGRLRGPWQPLACFDGPDAAVPTPAGPCATGLDPVAALSLRITLPPHGSAQFTLATAAASDRATLEALVDRYRLAAGVQRSSELSATLATLRLRDARLAPGELVTLQTLTTLLDQLHARPSTQWQDVRPQAEDQSASIRLPSPPCNRQLLWRLGLSGERPIIVVSVSALHGLRMVRLLVQGLLRWAWGGVDCDLVLINGEAPSYLQPLQRELLALRERHANESGATPTRANGLWVLQAADLSPAESNTLALLARVRLNADGRPLAHHVADLLAWHDAALALRDDQDRVALAKSVARPAAGTLAEPGAFHGQSGDFSFHASARQPTPRPWVNVLANADFGALVSEAGAGCTWAGNSRLHQLTPWSNDVLADNNGESFCLQNVSTREVWSLGAGLGSADVRYRIDHSAGSTCISHEQGGVSVEATWSVDTSLAVKRVHVQLHNPGDSDLTLRVVALLEWLLGAVRVDRQSVRTALVSLPGERDAPRAQALLATQLDDHDGAAGHTAFVTLQRDGATTAPLDDWTCDRRELFDARGRPVLPDHLGQRSGGGTDPCAAVSIALRLPAGATSGCVFTLGHAATPDAAMVLARASLKLDAAHAAADTRLQVKALLGAVTVQTPDPLFDALVNHWLLYQTTACRLWGRAGFYQAGGAYGFRDQLQDAMALAVSAPQLLRAHLLRAGARQYPQGDVQHWWHPHSGAGVRTHFSDDLLWLPHATLHYVATTGDDAIYDELLPFIEGDPVPAGAEDLYSVPRISEQHASLFEHCARTLDCSLEVGVHGLPLMGGGDWNDGMNLVGSGGRGESVWLAWFLCRLVTDFAPVASARGEHMRAARWQSAAQGWRAALQGPAWDGAWYRRAFFDDGSPLGAQANGECRIDLIAQAWSVLSEAAPAERQRIAMASADRALSDAELGLLRLLDPPLAQATPSAGYIQAYPPGVRENGGQYSHGAVWAVMAWAQLGQADAAWRAFVAVSPAHRAAHPVLGPIYGLEPYAVAADVYSQPPYGGRGGWSWYTGSAAGLYRAAVQSICGLQVQGGRVRLQPALPTHWRSLHITLRRAGGVYRFTVCAATAQPEVDAALAEGAHRLRVGMWMDLRAAGAASHFVVVCAAALPALQPVAA